MFLGQQFQRFSKHCLRDEIFWQSRLRMHWGMRVGWGRERPPISQDIEIYCYVYVLAVSSFGVTSNIRPITQSIIATSSLISLLKVWLSSPSPAPMDQIASSIDRLRLLTFALWLWFWGHSCHKITCEHDGWSPIIDWNVFRCISSKISSVSRFLQLNSQSETEFHRQCIK